MSREVELELLWKGQTEAAYLVEDEDEKDVWLPKSRVELETGSEINEACCFLIPEWLAIEKGLV